MGILKHLGRTKKERPPRIGETVSVDVTQDGNRVSVEGDGINISYSVEGVTLPPGIDASFVAWGLLPAAMEEGFNLQINRPIDPEVAANAERLSEIWEMWLPGQYRSINVAGQGEWSRIPRKRLARAHLFSGGIDSAFAILRARDPKQEGVAVTVCGIDKTNERNFDRLVSKTDSLLGQLNCRRIVVRTNAQRQPSGITHGLTLASCLFFLSDLFEVGILAADRSPAGDAVHFPWGSNHVTNAYFTGSDFIVRTVGAIGRAEKIAALVEAGIDLQSLSICRNGDTIPENCGRCAKCIRTKAEFLSTIGYIPNIFLDASINGDMLHQLVNKDSERYHFFDFYTYAKKHGTAEKIPDLERVAEEWRALVTLPIRRRVAK